MEINLRVEGSMDHFGGKKRHSTNKSQNGDLIKLTVTHAWGLANCYRITQPLIMVKCQTSLSSVSLEEVVLTAQVGSVLQPSTLEPLSTSSNPISDCGYWKSGSQVGLLPASPEKSLQHIIAWGFKYTMSHSFPLVGVFVSPSLELVLDTILRLSTCHQVWERHWYCTSKVQVVGVAVWLLEEAQYFCCERHKHLVVTLLELLEHLLQTPWEVSRVCSDLTQWSWHRLPHGFLLTPDILGFHIPMKVSTPVFSHLLFDYLLCKWAEPSPKCRLLTNPHPIYPGNKMGSTGFASAKQAPKLPIIVLTLFFFNINPTRRIQDLQSLVYHIRIYYFALLIFSM